MPKRTDIHTILIIGSGPIVIGQGCEFDYSGTQACKALKEEGYRVVLVNSNPATIMTDPEFADRTYIEPITPEAVTKIIETERAAGTPIDALLPTLGGQTGLNCACQLWDSGTLEKYNIEMIGANRQVIHRAEDRAEFRTIVENLGLAQPLAKTVNTMDEAWEFLKIIGLPAIIRPAFTLGGTGGGIAYNREEFEQIIRRGLDASMIKQVLIDQSVLGWKEYELEVMRDRNDNVVIICSIENLDPMGVHTGDSITVAPAQTLSDREYQRMRDASIAIIRAVGVETGGCNIQFAIDPAKGDMVVVEMNPRVSRSSALASKATGFAIAKIAAKLAVGYTLDELPNDITGETKASFEPTIDYVVTKLPRWTFEKFPEADETLTTQMKSVGEAMSIGRTFKESLQKGIRSMEVKRFGLGLDKNDKWFAHRRATERGESTVGIDWPIPAEKLRRKLSVPSQGRLYYIRYAFKMGWTLEQVFELTKVDPWFLDQLQQLIAFEDTLCSYEKLDAVPADVLRQAKQMGYSDPQLANLYLGDINVDTILAVRARRRELGIEPVYKLVDTCAAEFEAATPYYYSTYETPYTVVDPKIPQSEIRNPQSDDEVRITDRKKIVILGGGPNRIGQGIEFDYCCVQAAFAAQELGYEAVMVNSNPETVSTDYDTSDLLFFEPLTLEDVLNICERLNGAPLSGIDYLVSEKKKALLPSNFEETVIPLLREKEIRHCAVIAVSPGQGDSAGLVELVDAKGLLWNLIHPATAAATLERGNTEYEYVAERESRVDEWLNSSHGNLHGVIVQYGGQTPLNLAHGLQKAGVPIIGTPVDSIDLAGSRERFRDLLKRLAIRQPENGIAFSLEQAVEAATRIGYPVLVRPSYVLGGRGMETCFNEAQLLRYMKTAVDVSEMANAPVLIDKFLSEAIEVDVDVVADHAAGNDSPTAMIAGVMEHIEEAGIHSGDSACALPPYSLPKRVVDRLIEQSKKLAAALKVRGLMNVQYAITRPRGTEGPRDQGTKGSDPSAPGSLGPSVPGSLPSDYEIYVLEVNPRASRTVPFVSKATGISWARVAAKVMAGQRLADLGVAENLYPKHTSVKESVFPFSKFPGVDVILGPEMRSTGEVMGADADFAVAFAKAQMAAGGQLPTRGNVFLSVRDSDKPAILDVARRLLDQDFTICSTGGTFDYLASHNITARRVNKISEGRPNALDMISDGQLQLIINTPTKKGMATDEGKLRATAVRYNVPMVTTTTGAAAAVRAIAALRRDNWTVKAVQDYYPVYNTGLVPDTGAAVAR